MLASEQFRALSAQFPHQRDTATAAILQALHLLSRASADWRNGGQSAEGALHWPVALALARREIGKALDALGNHRQAGDHPPEWRCEYLEAFEDTDDARAGLAWYNSATVTERRHWHHVARSAVPADAWEAYKAGVSQP